MGTVATSEDMVNGIMGGFEADPEGMWDTNLFGKSLRGMVSEGLNGKVTCLNDETRTKLRRAITRMVNESKGSVICILL
jgi:stage IV sporulation protein A